MGFTVIQLQLDVSRAHMLPWGMDAHPACRSALRRLLAAEEGASGRAAAQHTEVSEGCLVFC